MTLKDEKGAVWKGWDIDFPDDICETIDRTNIHEEDGTITMEFYWTIEPRCHNDKPEYIYYMYKTKVIGCQISAGQSQECIKVDHYGFHWHCYYEKTCVKKCPLKAEGLVYWQCGENQTFVTEWPDFSNCTSSWIENTLLLISGDKINPLTLMMELDRHVKDSSLFGHEIPISLSFANISLEMFLQSNLEKGDEEPLETRQFQINYFTDLAMGVIAKFLALQIPWQQLNERERISLGFKLNEMVEIYGLSVTNVSKYIGSEFNTSHIKRHLLMEAHYLQLDDVENSQNMYRFPFHGIPSQISSIVIQKLPNKCPNISVVELEAVGQIIPMAVAEKLFITRNISKFDGTKRINSGIISLKLYGPGGEVIKYFDSENAVLVSLKHSRQVKGPSYETIWHELYPGEKPTAIEGTEQCAYWNDSSSEWDTEGCRIVSRSHWFTTCECNHLSSFAVFTKDHVHTPKDFMYELMSIIFSSLSVICLILTLISLYFFDESHEERNLIGKHMCGCLLVGHLLALTVLDGSFLQLAPRHCEEAAICLHYVFIAAFMWMVIEGHHLYRMLISVFDSGRDFSTIYICLAYGIPLVIVVVTCIITAIFSDNGYADDELCWLSSPNYIWAFFGPILVLTLINIVTLVLAMRVVVIASNKNVKSYRKRVIIWLRGWFSLSSLLGVTWIFGFFYIELDHNFAYAFVTLNGLQGILLFLSRVVFNRQIRTSFKKRCKAMIKENKGKLKCLCKFNCKKKVHEPKSSVQSSHWALGDSFSTSQPESTSTTSASFSNVTSSTQSLFFKRRFGPIERRSYTIDQTIRDIEKSKSVIAGFQSTKKRKSENEEVQKALLQRQNVHHISTTNIMDSNIGDDSTLPKIHDEL
ncbi:Hypothetical predicted protein [Cloeon dipterum]|uniref:GPS domain-containing protein n=1 Tax=Cloeon dipterum TaxID=197152 RepID=A0A8S1C6V2_9INSE|nr:Hypothetical predicted protein [Cloeon dipterum]